MAPTIFRWLPKTTVRSRRRPVCFNRCILLFIVSLFIINYLLFRQNKRPSRKIQGLSNSIKDIFQRSKEERNRLVRVALGFNADGSLKTYERSKPEVSALQLQEFIVQSYNKLGQLPYGKKQNLSSLVDSAFNQHNSTARLEENLGANQQVRNLVIWLKLIAKQKREFRTFRKSTRRIEKPPGPTINLATAICASGRKAHGLTMIKSASMFAQDASLNVIVFSDADTIMDIGMDLLQLRWSVNLAGWDFTFELKPEWRASELPGWKPLGSGTACEVIPMFFPLLLPEMDSLIYLDHEVLVLSNLTELWNKIETDLSGSKLVAAAPNAEPDSVNWYTFNKLPHFGTQGVSSGVLLMNLTRMRAFNFTSSAMGIQEAYQEELKTGFQDILNSIFQVYDEWIHLLQCTHNLYYVHCDKGVRCNRNTKSDTCFCEAARSEGVHLIYGCSNSFSWLGSENFIAQAYTAFEGFDLLHETPMELMERLRKDFELQTKCYNATYDMVYKNARLYLEKL